MLTAALFCIVVLLFLILNYAIKAAGYAQMQHDMLKENLEKQNDIFKTISQRLRNKGPSDREVEELRLYAEADLEPRPPTEY